MCGISRAGTAATWPSISCANGWKRSCKSYPIDVTRKLRCPRSSALSLRAAKRELFRRELDSTRSDGLEQERRRIHGRANLRDAGATFFESGGVGDRGLRPTFPPPRKIG